MNQITPSQLGSLSHRARGSFSVRSNSEAGPLMPKNSYLGKRTPLYFKLSGCVPWLSFGGLHGFCTGSLFTKQAPGATGPVGS